MVCHVLDQVLEEHDRLVYLFHHLHSARHIVDTSSGRIKVSPLLKDSLPCAFQLGSRNCWMSGTKRVANVRA